MTDYLKTAKDKVAELGAQFSAKAKEVAAGISNLATGNSGMLGGAKKDIQSRQDKIDKAVDDASMANGGRVGRRPQRG